MLTPEKKGIFSKYRLLWIWGAIIAQGGVLLIAGLLLVIVAVLVLVIGGYVGFHVVESPGFCGAMCHSYMKYSHESWKKSDHHGVNCGECHYEPGLKGFYEGGIKGAIYEMWVYYVTGDYEEPYASNKILPISGKSCKHCHPEEKLETRETLFNSVSFTHDHHLSDRELEESAGLRVKCTLCHAKDEKVHMEEDTSICFLCHLRSKGDLSMSCLDCHTRPPEVVYEGMRYNHPDWKNSSQCAVCHPEIGSGEGKVAKELCVRCHDDRFLKEYYPDSITSARDMHEIHVGEDKARCSECHEGIVHETKRPFEVECGLCHPNEKRMYQGINAFGTRVSPSMMFVEVEMSCVDCHRKEDKYRPQESGCRDCHEGETNRSIEECQAQYKLMLSKLKGLRDSIAKALQEADGEDSLEARSLFDQASFNLKVVEDDLSSGVHNFTYCEALIAEAKEKLELAGKELQ
ncbi:MAG: hypothetical protein JSU92_13280 [Deltaproteobacteria bacterium]|nr:MAG: hypothetical protein JSU92_13280 [Deltaproteobacteria bacterium]